MAIFGVSTVYKAAKLSAGNEAWQPIRKMTPDREMTGEMDSVRARCRDLVRNNALAASVMATFQDYIGSTGLSPVQGDQGGIDVWSEWAEGCSLSGVSAFEDLNRDIIGAQGETGDVLLTTPINPTKKWVKTSIDLVEGDRVRTPLEFKEGKDGKGRTLRNGVVFDSYGAEIGYYVAKINPRTSRYEEGGADAYHYFDAYGPNGRFNARLVRRPDKMRPGQTRQMPIFVAVAQQFWDVDAFWDAAISKARAQSLVAAIFEGDDTSSVDAAMGVDQTSDATSYTDNFGEPINVGSIPSGAMIKIPFGTKVSTITPSGAMDLDTLLMRSMRLMGAAMGMPYELIGRDFSQTNFSSGKLSHDGFFRLVDRWNRGNARQYASHLYRLVCVEAMLLGDPRVQGLTDDRLKVKWIGGPRTYNANPASEASAEQMRMDNNLTTEEMLSAEAGNDYREVLESRARVIKSQREIEIKYGLPEGALSRKAGAVTVNSFDGAPDPAKKKKDDDKGGDE